MYLIQSSDIQIQICRVASDDALEVLNDEGAQPRYGSFLHFNNEQNSQFYSVSLNIFYTTFILPFKSTKDLLVIGCLQPSQRSTTTILSSLSNVVWIILSTEINDEQ